MKMLFLVVACIMYSCVYYVPVEPVTKDDPERAVNVLSDSGYTDIKITGECWQEFCQECFGTGFVATKDSVTVAGCVKENLYEYGVNPRIILERVDN